MPPVGLVRFPPPLHQFYRGHLFWGFFHMTASSASTATVRSSTNTSARPLYVIDFETYYDREFSLSKMTTEEYIRDPRFQVMMVGVIFPDESRRVFRPNEFRAWAASVPWDNAAVLAHHAHFDGRILAHHFGVFPGFWYDTLCMARALHGAEVGGSLKALMEHYGVGHKGTTVGDMIGRRVESLTSAEWQQYAAYCINDCAGTLGIFKKMIAENGGFPDRELAHIDTTIRMFTEPVFVLDEPSMKAYHLDEVTRKQKMLDTLGVDRADLMSDDKFAGLLMQLGVVPPTKWSKKKQEEAYAFAKSDPGMKELLEHDNEIVQTLAEARLAHKSTINISRSERLIKLGANGQAMPVYLKYSGAHTHRWSGADKMNWQNFERTNKKDPRKGAIRKAIMAPEGWTLVVADSAQIEARVLAWLAEQEDLVEAFAQKRDVYSERASLIYGRKVDRKKNPEDEVPGFVGKVVTLGLGYGMGWAKFAQTLLAGAMGGPPVIFTRKDAASMGVNIASFMGRKHGSRKCEDIAREMPSLLPPDDRVVHCAVSCHIVDVYRRNHKQIVEFWDACDGMISQMISMREGVKQEYGCITLEKGRIILPSGLALHYPGLRDTDDGYVYESRMGPTKLYGGLLCENITQALARVVVSDQIHSMREQGYKIATTTHDEVVLCVPEQHAQQALDFALKSMKTAPDWADGLPLNAEGSFARRYGDAK